MMKVWVVVSSRFMYYKLRRALANYFEVKKLKLHMGDLVIMQGHTILIVIDDII